MYRKIVKVNNIEIGNHLPLVLISGLNVIENREITFDTARYIKKICSKLDIPFIFKASFDKANRSSISSFRGPGMEKGLQVLSDIKNKLGIPILSDIHEPYQAKVAAEICDIIQLPAFLARQTDLIKSMAKTKIPINIKKPQFLSPNQVINIVNKFYSEGNENLLICERGHCFGYDNLVVDMLGFNIVKETCFNLPFIFDVTHSLQCRNSNSKVSGGRKEQLFELARAGTAIGIAGLFVECHPDPNQALCDGPSALEINKLEILLNQIKKIDLIIKNLNPISHI